MRDNYTSRALHSPKGSLWAGEINFGPITLSLLHTIVFYVYVDIFGLYFLLTDHVNVCER